MTATSTPRWRVRLLLDFPPETIDTHADNIRLIFPTLYAAKVLHKPNKPVVAVAATVAADTERKAIAELRRLVATGLAMNRVDLVESRAEPSGQEPDFVAES
ncbi:hypothetical protein [Nonomuraea sp. NPDC005650]|uniref:hypothetical protein n=1 Tax=Nonomuraea sp. NPDC005650 TaxID=3157045 RepID=UPI0033BA84F0